MRDCFIQSIKDPSVVQHEKDLTIKGQLAGEKTVVLPTDVEDCCFCLNKRSIPAHSDEDDQEYVGVISLSSTTISDFHYGILGGSSSIINMDKSSVINNRGTAIRVVNPRVLKVQGAVFQKIAKTSIEIRLYETPDSMLREGSVPRSHENEASYSGSKLFVNQSRFIALEGPAITVHQLTQEDPRGLLKALDLEFNRHTECLNSTLKISGNKHYNSIGRFLDMEHVYFKSVEISKNDMFKNEGDAIFFRGVIAHNNEIKRNIIKDNIIQELERSNGIHLINSSCHIENNEIIKCGWHGIDV